MSERKTQEQRILKYLQSGRAINPIGALSRFDCFRLGARIYGLRQAGHNITSKTITTRKGKRFSEYSLSAS